MLKFTNVIGRTARILKPYSVQQRTGKNGTFESKMVMFSLATDRNYKQSVTHSDGTVTQERKTDFFACRCTGPIADLFNEYCSATSKDGQGNDKLVSRRIAISGHIEKYQATRTVQLEVEGKLVQAEIPEERDILVVEEIEFLDANPSRQNNNTGNAVSATVVQAAPVAQAQAAPVQAPVVAPVAAPTASTEVLPFQ